MSRWAWLSTSLTRNTGIFGEFDRCYAIGSPFTKHVSGDNGKLPLPISGKLFEHIIKTFNLSTTFLTIHNTGLATYTSTVSSRTRGDGSQWDSAQFVIQQNRAYSALSMALTFNIKSGRTRVLLFGAETGLLLELFEYLNSMSPQPYGPMVTATIVLELQAQRLTMTLQDCHNSIYSIETSTGMRQFNYAHERGDISHQDWKNLDLISITRDLSSFLTRFAFIKLQAETGTYLVQQMAETTRLLISQIGKDQPSSHIDDQHAIILKLKHIRNWYLGIEARCRYLTERTAAQTQTVYCLIASQDNLTNIDITRASHIIAKESHKESEAMRTIAELGRQDNQLMIQVAQDSRAVALAAARDSAAMQVISAVTILFLPATFTATFFSMTFFDFSGTEGPRVSPLTWIYVVVTIVLTIVIQLAWAETSKRKRARITQGVSS
ncbi:hypothetical protein F4777DRAFT_587921 [Nemania sp. FL0916]|nr:hypothetical protein F4777DRAFT_587921 [Nemania sp. FL0916]